MKRENLTETRIKSYACPIGKHQAFFWDATEKRLAVRVTSSGNKSYIFEGYLGKQTIRLTIGNVNDWNLDDARKEARRLQSLLDQKIDPREILKAKKAEKEATKAAIESNKTYTLEALLETYADYLDARGKRKSGKLARSVTKCHIKEVAPVLAATPANKVTSEQVAGIVRDVSEKGYSRTAGILRATLSAAFNCGRHALYDIQLPRKFIDFKIVNNPVDLTKAIPINTSDRKLTADDLKSYITALTDTNIDMALKLSLYSAGQRMAEILRAKVTDWDDVNKTLLLLDPKGKRTKPREHLLPLAETAAAIVSAQVSRARGLGADYLFPSATKKTPIHDTQIGPRVTEIANALNMTQFNLRDIRRTVETQLAELGVSRDIRSQLLSHGISGVQAVHYDRYDYIKEKKAVLIKWERHLFEIVNGREAGKVINLYQ
ncbi:MAG: tyrosine-type recombinase/integrase [Smithellaceae bacterium]